MERLKRDLYDEKRLNFIFCFMTSQEAKKPKWPFYDSGKIYCFKSSSTANDIFNITYMVFLQVGKVKSFAFCLIYHSILDTSNKF